MGCCQRFCLEFKRPMFDLDESPMGRLDLRESFHIGEGLLSWVGIVKLIVLAIVVAAFVHAILEFPVAEWYPAYLTPWGVFFCVWYLTGSLFVTTGWCNGSSSSSSEAETISHVETPTTLVKFTWMVFSLAIVFEACIFVMYWTFDFNPDRDSIDLRNLNVHGILMVITLLHGTRVDRVPVRIKHIVLTFTVAFFFCGWLAIQNVVVKYNPMQDDDDDALYDVMKWRENPTQAAILSAVVLFGALPFFTVLLWLLSIPGRLYLQILDGGTEGVVDYEKAISQATKDEEVVNC